MIDFSLNNRQRKMLEKAQDFAKKGIAPVALEYDRTGKYPEAILKKAWQAGLMYTNIPIEYGGSGMSMLEHYIVGEALSYECCAIAQMIGISHLSMAALDIAGTKKQKKLLLGKMCEGYRSGAFCLTEPQAGSDVGSMKTTAVKKGDSYT